MKRSEARCQRQEHSISVNGAEIQSSTFLEFVFILDGFARLDIFSSAVSWPGNRFLLKVKLRSSLYLVIYFIAYNDTYSEKKRTTKKNYLNNGNDWTINIRSQHWPKQQWKVCLKIFLNIINKNKRSNKNGKTWQMKFVKLKISSTHFMIIFKYSFWTHIYLFEFWWLYKWLLNISKNRFIIAGSLNYIFCFVSVNFENLLFFQCQFMSL